MLVICANPHFEAPTCPFALEVLRAREHTPTPYSSVVFTFGLVVESIKEFGGMLMKSMDTLSHNPLGIGNSHNNLACFLLNVQFCWQVK